MGVSAWVAGTVGDYPHMRQQQYATWTLLCVVDGKSGNAHKQATNHADSNLPVGAQQIIATASTSRATQVLVLHPIWIEPTGQWMQWVGDMGSASPDGSGNGLTAMDRQILDKRSTDG